MELALEPRFDSEMAAIKLAFEMSPGTMQLWCSLAGRKTQNIVYDQFIHWKFEN